MKWIIIALVAGAALVAFGLMASGSHDKGAASRNPEAMRLCDEGTADLHAFRLRAAVQKLGQALQADPALAEASISRTLAFAQLGERQNLKRELARADSLTAAVKDDHRRLLAQLRLGSVNGSRYYVMRDSVYQSLKVTDPENIYMLVAAAERAELAQDRDEVEKAWLRILAKDPNYANSYNQLGYMELNRGNYEQAIEYMQKYAFLAPDLANPHDSLGEVYLALGRYEEAEAEFVKSVTMQSDFYHSLINLGKVYLARGELRRGLDILEKLRGQVAGSELETRVDREIISTYLRAGLQDKLADATARFVAHYPDQDTAPIYRAVRLAYLGRSSEGQAVLDSTLAAKRADDVYKRYEKARQGVESTAKQFEGIAADLAGDSPRAAAAWGSALRILAPGAPRHELFYLQYRLAAALNAEGKSREALAELDAMLAINPRQPDALLLKARCHRELGEKDAAIATLQALETALAKADPDLPILAQTAALRKELGVTAPAS